MRVTMFVLVHGNHGRVTDFCKIEDCIRRRFPQSEQHMLRVHRSGNNQRLRTHDGVDVCGARLAEEIVGWVREVYAAQTGKKQLTVPQSPTPAAATTVTATRLTSSRTPQSQSRPGSATPPRSPTAATTAAVIASAGSAGSAAVSSETASSTSLSTTSTSLSSPASSTPPKIDLNIMAHSLGGLISRYAVALLDPASSMCILNDSDRAIFRECVEFRSFVAMNSPHLGSRRPTSTAWFNHVRRVAQHALLKYIYGRTGMQLLLEDDGVHVAPVKKEKEGGFFARALSFRKGGRASSAPPVSPLSAIASMVLGDYAGMDASETLSSLSSSRAATPSSASSASSSSAAASSSAVASDASVAVREAVSDVALDTPAPLPPAATAALLSTLPSSPQTSSSSSSTSWSSSSSRRPLLLQMSEIDSPFMSALSKFTHRTLVSMVDNDFLVPHSASSLTDAKLSVPVLAKNAWKIIRLQGFEAHPIHEDEELALVHMLHSDEVLPPGDDDVDVKASKKNAISGGGGGGGDGARTPVIGCGRPASVVEDDDDCDDNDDADKSGRNKQQRLTVAASAVEVETQKMSNTDGSSSSSGDDNSKAVASALVAAAAATSGATSDMLDKAEQEIARTIDQFTPDTHGEVEYYPAMLQNLQSLNWRRVDIAMACNLAPVFSHDFTIGKRFFPLQASLDFIDFITRVVTGDATK